MKSIPKYIFLFVIIFYANVLSQNHYGHISGKIIDNSSKEGLPNANIYFSKTTFGTTSNQDGFYYLNNVPTGDYTLVVSMIGYKPSVKSIEILQDSVLNIEIYLEQKTIELNTVEVVGDKSLYEKYKREQYEYRQIFKKYFLGQTPNSEECKIKNEEKIKFKKNTLGFIEATCSEPIIVINDALGYELECLLEKFLCNDSKGSVQMLFYPRFTELKSKDQDQIEEWEEHRDEAYISSLRRFMLSVVNNRIQENGYGLYLTYNNFNIDGIPKAKLKYGIENISKVDSSNHRVKLSFDGFLLVFNNITEEISWINLPLGEAKIGEDGYIEDPLTMTVYNSFAKRGIADSLPDNFNYKN